MTMKEYQKCAKEMLEFIEKSGMKLLAVYGDDTFNPPAGTSQRLIYAALQPNPR